MYVCISISYIFVYISFNDCVTIIYRYIIYFIFKKYFRDYKDSIIILYTLMYNNIYNIIQLQITRYFKNVVINVIYE